MTFYQFLESNRGAQLLEIFHLGGQPNPAQWDHHERNWIQSKQDWDDKLKSDPQSPEFHSRMMFKSKSFMAEYWRIVNIIITNPFVLTQEELLWSFQLLCQQLLDMNLVKQEDLKLKLKKSSMTFLQKFALVPTKILECEGDWEKLHKVLVTILPVSAKSWMFTNIRKQDWGVLQTEKLPAIIANETVAVPKFKYLPEHYR